MVLEDMLNEREEIGGAKVLVKAVQNFMKNSESSITLEEACKILGHTVEEYNKDLELLRAEKQ